MCSHASDAVLHNEDGSWRNGDSGMVRQVHPSEPLAVFYLSYTFETWLGFAHIWDTVVELFVTHPKLGQ